MEHLLIREITITGLVPLYRVWRMPALLIAGSVISVVKSRRESVCLSITLLPSHSPFQAGLFLNLFDTLLSLIFTHIISSLINGDRNLFAFLKKSALVDRFQSSELPFYTKTSPYSLVCKSLFPRTVLAPYASQLLGLKSSNCDSFRRTCRPVGLASEWRKKLACCHTSRVNSTQ